MKTGCTGYCEIQGVTFANRVLRLGNRMVDFKSPGDRDCLGIMTGAEEGRKRGSPGCEEIFTPWSLAWK